MGVDGDELNKVDDAVAAGVAVAVVAVVVVEGVAVAAVAAALFVVRRRPLSLR
jgi:MFS superfamily sulfate permease-like transporter